MPAFWDLVVTRLYFVDGAATRGAATPAVDGFRLLFETPSSRPPRPLNEGRTKLFGRVAGAALEVRGCRPGTPLAATAEIWTNQRRSFHPPPGRQKKKFFGKNM